MAKRRKQLVLFGAAGHSLASAVVFAGDPDDSDEDGNASTTHLFRIAGTTLAFVEKVAFNVVDAWMSDNGTLYCTSGDGHVAIRSGRTWTRERVSDGAGPHSPARLFGFSGDSSRQDIVVAGSDRALHIRRRGTWKSHEFPPSVEMTFVFHGLSIDSIYVCTDGENLHRWTGEKFQHVRMPFPEEPSGIVVLPPDDLVVTADAIRLRTNKKWTTLEQSHGSPTIALAQLGDDLFIGTSGGILHRRARSTTVDLAVPGYCNTLTSVGDAILGGHAFEGTTVHIFDRHRWRETGTL